MSGGWHRGKRAKARRGRAKRKRAWESLSNWAAAIIVVAVIAIIAWAAWPVPKLTSPTPTPTQPPEVTPSPTPPIPPRAYIGIVDQFYSQNPRFTDEAIKFIRDQGLTVEAYKDNEVTVELYRKLSTYGYRLIILRVHAGVCERLTEHPTFLFTAEPYSTSKYVVEQLTDQIMSGVINPGAGEPPVFTVGPMFIRMSMEGNFRGAVIILSSCLGLYNRYLAEALIEKGASVFISWDEKVSLEHTDKAAALLLKALVQDKMNIKQAVERVMEEVGADPTYGSILKYYPAEASGLKITPIIASIEKKEVYANRSQFMIHIRREGHAPY